MPLHLLVWTSAVPGADCDTCRLMSRTHQSGMGQQLTACPAVGQGPKHERSANTQCEPACPWVMQASEERPGHTMSALLYLMPFWPSSRASAASPFSPTAPQDAISAGCVRGLQQTPLEQAILMHAQFSSGRSVTIILSKRPRMSMPISVPQAATGAESSLQTLIDRVHITQRHVPDSAIHDPGRDLRSHVHGSIQRPSSAVARVAQHGLHGSVPLLLPHQRLLRLLALLLYSLCATAGSVRWEVCVHNCASAPPMASGGGQNPAPCMCNMPSLTGRGSGFGAPWYKTQGRRRACRVAAPTGNLAEESQMTLCNVQMRRRRHQGGEKEAPWLHRQPCRHLWQSCRRAHHTACGRCTCHRRLWDGWSRLGPETGA